MYRIRSATGGIFYSCAIHEDDCRDEVIFISTQNPERQHCTHIGAVLSDSKVEDKDGAFFNCNCD